MRKFSYVGIRRLQVLSLQIGGVFGIIAATLFAICVLAAMIQVGFEQTESYLCLVVWFPVVGWTVSLTLINALPTVWTSERGLWISTFFIKRAFIPWNEVVDVRTSHTGFGDILVRARRITPFHIVYGWLYSHSFLPSFFISKGIVDYEELMREFRRQGLVVG